MEEWLELRLRVLDKNKELLLCCKKEELYSKTGITSYGLPGTYFNKNKVKFYIEEYKIKKTEEDF